MRARVAGLLCLAVLWPALVWAQATRITSGGTLPSTCATGNVYYKTGASAGFYTCESNAWTGPYPTAAGGGSGTVTTTGSPASGDLAEFSSTTAITTATATGSGSVVRATSPTLVTPALGTPASGTLTNATGLPLAGLVAPADDQALVSNGTAVQGKALPDCDDSSGNHLNYDTATNAYSCGTSSSGGGSILRSVGITIDGGGSVISTGVKGFVSVPFSGTITGARLLSTDASATAGSAVIGVWKDTYANYPPTIGDVICASACPTLSAVSKADDTTLTGWSTTVTAGDVFAFSVTSASTVTRLTLILSITE